MLLHEHEHSWRMVDDCTEVMKFIEKDEDLILSYRNHAKQFRTHRLQHHCQF